MRWSRIAAMLILAVALGVASPSEVATRAGELPVSQDDLIGEDSSDEFWGRFMGFEPTTMSWYDYRTLPEMTGSVDLIIRGRIIDLYIGEERRLNEIEPPISIAYVGVSVDEVLKGEPVVRSPGRVEVLFSPVGDDFDAGDYARPSEEYVWFLNHLPTRRDASGRPQFTSDIAPFSYFRPNSRQTVLRNTAGFVDVVLSEKIGLAYGEDAFPLELDGMSVAELSAQIANALPLEPPH